MKRAEYYIVIVIVIVSLLQYNHAITITLSFSDGYKSHLTIAQKLIDLEFNATFFLNSANLEFKPNFMNVFDINWLVEHTFEIGGHTINHIELPPQNSPTMIEQICRDRATLIANGWFPKSFHYPLGELNKLTNKIVKECGYNGALISTTNQSSIVYIKNQYEIPIYSVPHKISLSELMNQTIISKGWTIFNFHNISLENNSTIYRFLDWLKIKQSSNEIVIKSVDNMIHGLWMPIPNEYTNTLPTLTPDPNTQLKIIIGSSCIGLLVIVVLYVIVATQIKRRTKIKFIC